MTTASMSGSSVRGTGTGCSRRGPTSWDGETRSLHTGSSRTVAPSISTIAEACPYQVMCRPFADSGSDDVDGDGGAVTTGTGPDGLRSGCRRSASRSSLGPPVGMLLPGTELRNLPSRHCGERRTRSPRSPSSGDAPIWVGMSLTAQTATAAAAAPTASFVSLRAIRHPTRRTRRCRIRPKGGTPPRRRPPYAQEALSPSYRSAMADDFSPPPLEWLNEDWQRALAIVAHPDDLEYGAASAVARWTDQGKTVIYSLVTSGEAGIDGMDPAEAGPLREREEVAGAAVVGVDTVEFLGGADGMLEYGLPLRRLLSAAIRRHRPDVVVTGNHRETFGPGMLNQADHIAVGRAVIDAARDAGNRWVFRDLLEAGLEPWNGVKAILVSGSPEATHGVDVTATLERGFASLKAHEAYLAGLSQQMDVEEFLESFARATGTRLGCTFGVAF